MYPGVVLFVFLLVSATNGGICPHCGKYFEVVGRHVWRCQSNPGTIATGQLPRPPLSTPLEIAQLSTSQPVEIPDVTGSPISSSNSGKRQRRKSRGALLPPDNTAAE